MADAKQVGKPPVEDFYNGSSPQNRLVLAKPRLGGFGSSGFGSSSSKGNNPFGSVLRPSQLKPGSNPFQKVTDAPPEAETENEKDVEVEKEPREDRLKEEKEDAEAPKFVPLGSTNATPRTTNPVPAPAQPTSSSSSSGFVFGQNLSERVVMQEAAVNNGDAAPADHSCTNGTTELLFTSAAASVKDNQEEAGGGESAVGLAAAAAEYERSHARPPPPAAAHSLTGEEGETNVLQISCRLFAWESGSWRERGRGVLRLNDAEPHSAGAGWSGAGACGGAARLVVRVSGSLRVVLNTKLWAGMVVERAGTKSLRITAANATPAAAPTDTNNQIKLFLIMGAPGDIVQLYRALTARVAVTRRAASACAQNATSQQAAERLEAATEDDFDKSDEHDDKSDDKSDDPRPDLQPNDEQPKPIKRKEPAEADTPPKRQCPEILTE